MKVSMKILVFFLANLTYWVLGQSLHTYYADDLERQPGIIYVSKGFNTVIQLYDRFDVYTVTRGEVVQVQELDPATLWLYTVQSQGATGMTIMVNGRVLQLTVVVRPGDFNRTYRVELSRSVYGLSQSPRVSSPTSPPPNPPVSPPASSLETKGAGAQGEEKPTIPSVRLEFALESLSSRSAAISFTARNLAKEDIYLDVARLRVTQGGTTTPFTITRTPARVRLSPGEVQKGTITVRLQSNAPVEISWRVMGRSGGETTVTQPIPLK